MDPAEIISDLDEPKTVKKQSLDRRQLRIDSTSGNLRLIQWCAIVKQNRNAPGQAVTAMLTRGTEGSDRYCEYVHAHICMTPYHCVSLRMSESPASNLLIHTSTHTLEQAINVTCAHGL